MNRDKHSILNAWYQITNPEQSPVLSQHSFLLLHRTEAEFLIQKGFAGPTELRTCGGWQKSHRSESLDPVVTSSKPCSINKGWQHPSDSPIICKLFRTPWGQYTGWGGNRLPGGDFCIWKVQWLQTPSMCIFISQCISGPHHSSLRLTDYYTTTISYISMGREKKISFFWSFLVCSGSPCWSVPLRFAIPRIPSVKLM